MIFSAKPSQILFINKQETNLASNAVQNQNKIIYYFQL